MNAESKLYHLKKRAKKKGIPCTLTIEQVESLLNQKTCYRCDRLFSESVPLTFDRTDPILGYTKRNTRAMCAECNNQDKSILDEKYKTLHIKHLEMHALYLQNRKVRYDARQRIR